MKGVIFYPGVFLLSVDIEKASPFEYPILKILSGSENPSGAGVLCEALSLQGITISEAGIGRALRNFRNKGLLERVGFQGHRITGAGVARLAELEETRQKAETLKQMLNQTGSLKGYSVLDILIARKAIESEAASQAAVRALPEDISRLENIVSAQYEEMGRNEDYSNLSSSFHHEILRIARVPLLETLYGLIGLSVQWQGFFIGTFKMYNQPVNKSHEKIVTAIKSKDPEKASLYMGRHLDDVIKNARRLFLGEDE